MRGRLGGKKVWLALTVCPFPAFLTYFLLPFPLLMRKILLQVTQRVFVVHYNTKKWIILTFWKRPDYGYMNPRENPVNLRSFLALRCLTHSVGLVLCVPRIKQCIIWILLLASICLFWVGHTSSVKNRQSVLFLKGQGSLCDSWWN